MKVFFPDELLPVKITLDPERQMTDDEYFEFCVANQDVWIERTAQGELVIVPPVGAECDHRCVLAGAQLCAWAYEDSRGKVSGVSAVFILPTGAALSPDAAWTSNHRLKKLTREQKRKFLPVCPEFVIEMMSPNDRLHRSQER
jgi:Uma2 family endonuclease